MHTDFDSNLAYVLHAVSCIIIGAAMDRLLVKLCKHLVSGFVVYSLTGVTVTATEIMTQSSLCYVSLHYKIAMKRNSGQ